MGERLFLTDRPARRVFIGPGLPRRNRHEKISANYLSPPRLGFVSTASRGHGGDWGVPGWATTFAGIAAPQSAVIWCYFAAYLHCAFAELGRARKIMVRRGGIRRGGHEQFRIASQRDEFSEDRGVSDETPA
jgi:hypothetical protein